MLNSAHFFIPRAPTFSSLYRQFRAALSRQIGSASGFALIGDSVTQGDAIGNANSTLNWAQSWTSLITAYANAYTSPGDLQIIHQFNTARPPSSAVAKGVTIPASPTFGTRGPTGQSLILAAGESITLIGNYAHVDVIYIQEPGAGTLSFSFNGAGPYKTVSAAGTLELDKTTYPSATGQVVSGTYTISASGGPVELTGVIRLATAVAGSPPLRVFNFGKNGETTPTGSTLTTRVASWYKQATLFGGTSPGAVLAFGANDQRSILPADIYTNTVAMITALRSAGFTDLWGMGIYKPDSLTSGYSPGCTFDGATGALRGAYADEGVPILPLDTIDFSGRTWLVSGHPKEAGQRLYAQMVVESIAQGRMSHG
jgi:lysophospholipase L1-like esterase